MHSGKNIFRVFISCFLLLLFMAKLTRTVFNPAKCQKANLILSTESSDDQEGQMKKLGKNNVNFNEVADCLHITPIANFFCSIISNTQPHYRIDFMVTNYPLVPTQPPDRLSA